MRKHFIVESGMLGLLLLLWMASPPARAADPSVVPISWWSFTAGSPTDTNALRIKSILLNANEYALTTWYNTAKNFDAQTGTYLSFGGTSEHYIRPVAVEAFSLAVSLQTGAYDASRTGVPLATARAMTLKLIGSLAYRHKVNTTGGWGSAWQSALWAAYAGQAGWMMWSDLSATDQEYVRKMVEYEANRFNTYTVPYYRSRSGTINYPGDSKAEENAWNAQILGLASAMMPQHANRSLWMNKNVELLISSYIRPMDINSQTVLHGRTVQSWVNGSNANDDGTVINHNLIHPDYMLAMNHNYAQAALFSLAGRPTPKAALWGTDRIYAALVDLNFTSPPHRAPGGTIYVDGKGNFYYPQGTDWGTGRRMNAVAVDVAAATLGTDNFASQKGAYWEALHATDALNMQNRFTDGRTYAGSPSDAGSEDSYQGREEWVAMLAAEAHLLKYVKNNQLFSIEYIAY
jgi:hypothetical protein